jgi:hypothetical protein
VAGTGIPAASSTVGSTSKALIKGKTVLPARTPPPGQRAINATPIPESLSVLFWM